MLPYSDRQKTEIHGKLQKLFAKQDGPFVKALDKALDSFNVSRQAYYGWTFIRNHVHRCLKVYVHTCRKAQCNAPVQCTIEAYKFSMPHTPCSLKTLRHSVIPSYLWQSKMHPSYWMLLYLQLRSLRVPSPSSV